MLQLSSISHDPHFHHTPLDHKQRSIRILTIQPCLTKGGYLQCSLRTGTIEDDYTCLSYTWGKENAAWPILVNSQLFFVRRNLMDFLEVAQEKYPNQPLWIDAICIDQCSVVERNHQVAQMGEIYTAAKYVIIWLGAVKPIAEFFQIWKQCHTLKSGPIWWYEVRKPLINVESGWLLLTQHGYWTRAWITQEIAHANSSSVLAENVELDRSLLKYIVNIPWYTHGGLDARFTSHIDFARGRRRLHNMSLFSILQALPDQNCQILRDRIYSLLALALDGARIPVDYEKSDMDLFVDIMEACRNQPVYALSS